MRKIAIRCKASFTTGMGHVYRQRHLAQVLRDRGVEIHFFISDHPPSIDLMKAGNFSIHIVDEKDGLPEDDTGFDLVILDIQDTEQPLIASWRRHAKKVVSFEDLGEGKNFVDLLIDCNLEEKESNKLNSIAKPLFGLSYSVIAPDFAEIHQREKIFSPTLENLLVTMGGTDPNQLTLKLAEIFRKWKKEISITFVVGPGFKKTQSLEEIASDNKTFQILRKVGNMADLLFKHQAVICSGGVTLHEALAVGTPPFVISQVPHQQEKARPIARAGATVDLGLPEDFDPQQILRILDISKIQLENMSREAKALVDGKGIYRVADEIQKLIRDGNDEN